MARTNLVTKRGISVLRLELPCEELAEVVHDALAGQVVVRQRVERLGGSGGEVVSKELAGSRPHPVV